MTRLPQYQPSFKRASTVKAGDWVLWLDPVPEYLFKVSEVGKRGILLTGYKGVGWYPRLDPAGKPYWRRPTRRELKTGCRCPPAPPHL